MRVFGALLAALVVACGILSAPAAAQPVGCSGSYNAKFDNGTGTKIAGAWVLSRPVISVSVVPAGKSSKTALWNATGPIADTGDQSFGQNVTVNLDASPVTAFQVAVKDGATQVCAMSFKILRLAAISSGSSLAFVVPERTSWSDKPFGVALPRLVAMDGVAIRYDGSTFFLTGQLQIGKSLRSDGDVQIKLDDKGFSLVKSVTLAVKPAADGSSAASVALNAIACPWQQQCTVSATLSPSPAILPAGTIVPPVTMSVDRFGSWSASANPAVSLNMGGAVAQISRFAIDDKSAAGLRIDGTLSVPALGNAALTLSKAGLAAAPGGGFAPTGDFTFTSKVTAGGLTISTQNTKGQFLDPAVSDQLATITADGSLAFAFKGMDDTGTVSVSNMKIVVPRTGDAWSFDLRDAHTQVSNLRLFGHQFVDCDFSGLTADEKNQIKPAADQSSLCLGMHLMPGNALADDDIIFGRFGFEVKNVNGALAVQPTSVRLVLPKTSKATIRLGGMPLTLSGLNVEIVNANGVLDEQAPVVDDQELAQRLSDHPVCKPFIRGTVTVTAPSLSAIAAMSGTAAPGGPQAVVSAAPQFEFGRRCMILAMNGFLPISMSPQSSILFTGITIVHVKDDAGKEINYASAAGSISSGSVTGVVRRLSYLRDGYTQKTITHFDPDWGLTVSINAARNPNAISDTLQKAGGILLGLLIHK